MTVFILVKPNVALSHDWPIIGEPQSLLRPELSALCEHAMDFNHTIDWEKSEILKVENNYFKRLISEAWFINAHPKVINRHGQDHEFW